MFDIFKQIIIDAKVIGDIFSHVWYIIFPVAFYYLFKNLWMDHVNSKFSKSFDNVLLEIIPSKNLEKSPKPMESIYSAMTGVLQGFNTIEEYVKGMFTHRFSLEIASNEGSVHFYIRTAKMFRNLVEAHFYAQYPDIIIREVPDYVNELPLMVPNDEWDIWGTDFELVKPDPYPIRTYKYFEEDVTGKMIDPLAGLIETIGKLEPGQKIWLQYIITPEKEKWNADEHKIIDKLTGRAKEKKGLLSDLIKDLGDIFGSVITGFFGPVEFSKKKESAADQPLEFRLTPVEKDILKAVENNLGKSMFRVKMRFLYLGKKSSFDKTNVSSFIGGIKQFNDINLNGFKPNDRSKTKAEYFWVNQRLRYRQRKIFKRYKDRDPTGATLVLSTEELATVYHMPDASVVAPAVTFVEAKRSAAPANLPIE